ncbi:MAG: hypothetical protein LBC09_07590 [Helicobacteraceae bacterium]|jgi:hypothetical protein|nr:hypothetical protein [Helicobacteraceae bacterium]
MQTKSAIILGLSFVVGLVIYPICDRWANNKYYTPVSVISASAGAFIQLGDDMQVPPEIYAQLVGKARQKAEVMARSLGMELGRATDVYAEPPNNSYNNYYDDGEKIEKTEKSWISVTVSHSLK